MSKNTNVNYISNQTFKVAPFPVLGGQNGQIRIKLRSETGETNWLNISPESFRRIEAVLLDQAVKDDAKEDEQDRVETVLLAGTNKWSIQINGMLDTSFPLQQTEAEAIEKAEKKYKGILIITTKDAVHYSNR